MPQEMDGRVESPTELAELIDSMENQYPGVYELEQTYALIRKKLETPQRLSRRQFSQSSGTVSNTTA